MSNENTETLEGFISIAINNKYPHEPLLETDFDKEVQELRELMAPRYPVTDADFERIKRKLKANIVVKMDLGVVIKGIQKHKPWLSKRRETLNFFFWNRYKKYLERVRYWNAGVIGNLSRISDEIVDCLGDPQVDEPFQRRGLVIGDVQSGKTANYTAICNKAADAGYRVVIVLAGMIESLRQQTQERLDTEFSGIMSKYVLDTQKTKKTVHVGVGNYGSENKITTFTSVTKDFDKNILSALNLSLHNVKGTVLFVVKKNKSILNNLINWLESNNLDRATGDIDLPLLLIDDEADNASINTKNDNQDPTAINNAIRQLLMLFRKASYLGVTATPYANIFINPDDERDMQGDDLFPKDFIYCLTPPTNYIGAESIFGEQAKFSSVLEEISSEEMDTFFPFNHKKDIEVNALPPSMKEAIAYFLLINGIRDVRGDIKEHRTMMIHVSRFTDVQNKIRDLVHYWLEYFQSDLRNYASLSEDQSDKIDNISFLKNVWQKYNLAEKVKIGSSPLTWYEFLKEYMLKAATPVTVCAVNQKNNTLGLNYHNNNESGLRVIAIGGNSLSRGLTLEGLCVSYFYRRSQMYDTLLQMGRWFGYRPGYEDLFKIWISSEAIDWYGYITAASEELKLECMRMQDVGLTPMEFGLKVRQDPASLIVTARNKMKTATSVKRDITISGRLLEAPRLIANISILEKNKAVIRDFIKQLPEIGNRVLRDKTEVWEGVNKKNIEKLIRDFKSHPWQLSFQSKVLADFIRDCDDLPEWDVVIAEGSGENMLLDCGKEKILIRTESRYIKATSNQISISGTKVRVGSGGDAKLGLTQQQKEEAESKFRQDNGEKNISDKAYLEIKRNPIVVLHVISVDRDSKDKNGYHKTQIDQGVQVPDYLYTLGIGIPNIGEEKVANYVVNMIELKQYYDVTEDEDEDEDE